MSNKDMCRLCLATDDLLWIFDKVNESKKINDVVYFATGIMISIKDVISQYICYSCYQFTVKMFQFRSQCMKSEKYLKEQCHKCLKNRQFNNSLSTQATLKSESNYKSHKPGNLCIHPSVYQISKTYPGIKLPALCLKSHLAPVVVMEINEVESYFQNRNLDINIYVKSALSSIKRTKRLVKLEENGANQQKTLNMTLKNGADIKLKKSSMVVNTKGLVKTNTIKQRRKKDSNTNTKRNVRRKALIAPRQISNSCKSKRAKLSNANTARYIESKSVKQVSKKYIKYIENGHKSVNFSLLKGIQLKSPGKNIGKRKLSQIATKINMKKPRLESLNMILNTVDLSSNQIGSSEALKEVENTTNSEPLTSLNMNNSSETLSYVDKSVPLHICDICNSIQYSAYQLRKHRIGHLRCQFCKRRFLALHIKIHHIENVCTIRKAMTNMPDVELKRIEFDIKMRRKYPEAFVNFPPLESDNYVDLTNSNDVCNRAMALLKLDITRKFKAVLSDMSTSKDCSNVALKKQTIKDINNIPVDRLDVIDILSDEEDISVTNGTFKTDDYHSNNYSTNLLSLCRDNLQNCSLTPDISIKNNSVLDNIDLMDSDVKILKKLILSQPIQPCIQKNVQTHLPTNKDIIILGKSKIILKDLQGHLRHYKIPVTQNFGKFNASYDYHTRQKKCSKLCLWNDLTPLDIKQTKYLSSTACETSGSLNSIKFYTSNDNSLPSSINGHSTESTMIDNEQSQDVEYVSFSLSESTTFDIETDILPNEDISLKDDSELIKNNLVTN